MKNTKLLLPIISASILAGGGIASLASCSCGGKEWIKWDLWKNKAEVEHSNPFDESTLPTGEKNSEECTKLYFEEVNKNPNIFINDWLYSVYKNKNDLFSDLLFYEFYDGYYKFRLNKCKWDSDNKQALISMEIEFYVEGKDEVYPEQKDTCECYFNIVDLPYIVDDNGGGDWVVQPRPYIDEWAPNGDWSLSCEMHQKCYGSSVEAKYSYNLNKDNYEFYEAYFEGMVIYMINNGSTYLSNITVE